ncbi:hypothetical protein OESDEN_05354 [Oesophagostomum dentatum]|uniref:LisH domain-containing protein n=1 Tax=Oesophagostomum dentatum TaxID=61180 RepID=A0A0B1TBT0_OESDE|nr:hypothetical protein OESDEN_05354 [Oesophagostomum dentatum]
MCFSKFLFIVINEVVLLGIVPYLEKPDVLRMILWMIGHDNTFEENSPKLTPIDVKCFLYTLSLWSDSWNYPVPVPARLRIKADQSNCWKALCQLIKKSPESETVKSVLLRSRVMDSVRLRYRVISLRRLYEVFRWLEVHVKNQHWLSLYATAVNEIVTGTHSHRRKCDDLFPDGNEVEDLTVEEVDHIEDHVSRYMASQFLCKGEYSNAEQLLIYSTSIESKKLLIKVYRKWLEVGNFKEPEISQLTKRIRGLEIECAEKEMRERTPSTNSAASAVSGGDTVTSAIPPSSRKILVDACTNTPSRVDSSTSAVDDASFFSVKSDRTSVTAGEESFASAVASPYGPNTSTKSSLAPTSRAPLPMSPLAEALMSKDDVKTQDKTVITQSSSITSSTGASPKFDDVALPENLGHSPLAPAKSVSSSPGVIVQNPTVPIVPSITASPIPIVITKTPFGPPVINKEAAASFWKSGKGHPFGLANKPAVGLQPAAPFGTTASPLAAPGHAATATTSTALPVMQPPFGVVAQPKPAPVGSTSVFGGSAQGLHIPSSTSPFPAPAYMNSPHSAPNLSQPGVLNPQMPQTSFGIASSLPKPTAMAPSSLANSQNVPGLPAFVNSPFSPANVSAVNECIDDDEHFCNDLMMEMCRKQLERVGKKPLGKEAPLDDLDELQKRIAQIDRQMRSVQSQLHVNTDLTSTGSSHVTAAKSAPTPAEIIRQHQKEALLELEQQVAQYVSPTGTHQPSAIPSSATSAQHEVECADPMNLIRGLLLSSNAAESPSVSRPSMFTDRTTTSSGIFKPAPEIVRKSPLEESMFKIVQAANHPGCKGICLGCADDDIQDRALRILTQLSEEWNAETDSDSD